MKAKPDLIEIDWDEYAPGYCKIFVYGFNVFQCVELKEKKYNDN